MTVYIDIVLIENLCMNYIILFATGYILKVKIKHIRIIISALIGGLYSILAYAQILEIYSNIFMKIILSIVMVYLSFNSKNIKQLAKQITIFYLVSFVFGGCSFALLYFIRPQEVFIKNGSFVGTYPIKIALLGGIVGFTITVIAFKIVKYRMQKKDMYCDITIFMEGKSITTKAIIDTGNMLKDPISRIPVIVVEKAILNDLIPYKILNNIEKIIEGSVDNQNYNEQELNYMSKFRVIPFTSLGKQNGLLLGIKADKVIVDIDIGEKEIKNIIVGIYDKKLSQTNKYNALIGLDIIEGSNKYEPITNNCK